MDHSERLSEFAKTKEVEFRRNLDDIKADVENKQVVCQGMLKSHDVIKSEQLLPPELEADEVHRQNIDSVLNVYSKVLEYIDDSASQLADAVHWGDQLYRLDPNRPYKEYIETRDTVAKDPNDNSGPQASGQLKERAKEMIDLDYKIKAGNGPLLEALVNCHTITDDLRKEFYSFMKEYYNIGTSNSFRLIPLKLCSNDLDDTVTSKDLIAYRQEMKEFRDKVWTFFERIVQTIWDKLQQN
uniref:BAR domain-containing protein n=1 Tax=Caenorhabditis tropicalis TaxID=1561998 RepID=A0A1I7UVI9_9PELO